jgi:hypothetical protein
MQILCKSFKEKTSQQQQKKKKKKKKKPPCKIFEKESKKKANKVLHANPLEEKKSKREPKRRTSYSGQEGEDSVSLTGLRCSGQVRLVREKEGY